MYKKFEINQAKIKGGCQSGSKVVTHDSKIDLHLVFTYSSLIFFEVNHQNGPKLLNRILTIVKLSSLACKV